MDTSVLLRLFVRGAESCESEVGGEELGRCHR